MPKLLPLIGLMATTATAFAQPTPHVRLAASTVITLPAGAAPSALAIADYNQDRRPDVAVCQRGLNSIGVYLQGSNGTFPSQPAGTYDAGQAPSGLVAVPLGNASQRAYIDLVAISGPSNLYTLLTNKNDGSGQFTPIPPGNGPVDNNYFGQVEGLVNPQLQARDLNSDGWIDFIYSIDPTGYTINAGIYRQRLLPEIRIQPGYEFSRFRTPAYRPSNFALADFNRDGVEDLVVTNPDNNQFTVVIASSRADRYPEWANNQRADVLPSLGSRPVQVAAADVSGDFLPDIALAHEGSNEITLFLNSRTGEFGTTVSYPLSAAPRQVMLQDLNDDRRPEMLVLTADGQLHVFEHTSEPGITRYRTPVSYAVGRNPVTMQFADVNGDFKLDVVIGCEGDNTVHVLLNQTGTVLSTATARLAGVDIYPNPARDVVTVRQSNASSQTLNATLLDALGRVVRRAELAAPAATLSVADLPRGVYVLRLSSTDGILTRRLVVE
ncbi:T9SS type A sorting domain-containing protein [Hymenobacter amundsenii]|nr:T9SS type A sorting domain-containing protein [Hymenobacter amundsenii]